MSTPAESLAALYRRTVLDHSRHPRNCLAMERPDHQATGHNPLCGDKVTVYARESRGVVTDAAFEASGCAISVASASMLTEMVRGHTTAEVRGLIRAVMDGFEGRGGADAPGEIAALSGVRAYPARVRCATLPWRTLEAALDDTKAAVSTE